MRKTLLIISAVVLGLMAEIVAGLAIALAHGSTVLAYAAFVLFVLFAAAGGLALCLA